MTFYVFEPSPLHAATLLCFYQRISGSDQLLFITIRQFGAEPVSIMELARIAGHTELETEHVIQRLAAMQMLCYRKLTDIDILSHQEQPGSLSV